MTLDVQQGGGTWKILTKFDIAGQEEVKENSDVKKSKIRSEFY